MHSDETNTPYFEFPAIRSIYNLFATEKNPAALHSHVDFKQFVAQHNYNKASREAVYAALGRWVLGKENKEEFIEKPLTINNLDSPPRFPGYTARRSQRRKSPRFRLEGDVGKTMARILSIRFSSH